MSTGRTTYCESDDVKLYYVNLRLPPDGVDIKDAIEAACDEADGYIGVRYHVPISVSESDSDKRHASLMLKTATAQLAAGRLITSAATGGERTGTHDYGKCLIKTALVTLRGIRDGRFNIPFAEEVDEVIDRHLGPMVIGDAHSQVDYFYNHYAEVGLVPSWHEGGDSPWQQQLP